MFLRYSGLWRHVDFLKLWAGETISLMGSQITLLALPLTAILTLHATSLQVGILGATGSIPMLLVSLFVGVWVDRFPRRTLLLISDLGQALLLSAVPLMALLGILQIESLYVINFLVGILTVFFGVAYQSYLPTLIETEEMVEGNSKLEASGAFAEVAGPGITGILVQVMTAPLAIVADVVSFLVSALCLGLIRRGEPAPSAGKEQASIWLQIGEGLQVVGHNPVLRAIASCNASLNFFNILSYTVFTLYAIREVHMSPALLGLTIAGGSVGALVGSFMATPAAKWFGVGRAIVGAVCLEGLGALLIPLAGGSLWLVIPMFIAGRFLMGGMDLIYHINQLSLRQIRTPNHLQGRVNATIRFIAGGVVAFSSLLGGFLGTVIGLRATLFLGSGGVCLSCLWLICSPIWKIADLQPARKSE
jgi:Sugar phosphate permease